MNILILLTAPALFLVSCAAVSNPKLYQSATPMNPREAYHLQAFDYSAWETEEKDSKGKTRYVTREIPDDQWAPLMERQMAAVDYFYDQYVLKLTRGESNTNMAASGLTQTLTSLGGLGATVFAQKEIQAMAAAASLVTGLNSTRKSEYLLAQNVWKITKTMETLRKNQRDEIRRLAGPTGANSQNRSDTLSPSFERLENELYQYFRAGTPTRALEAIYEQDVTPPVASKVNGRDVDNAGREITSPIPAEPTTTPTAAAQPTPPVVPGVSPSNRGTSSPNYGPYLLR